MERPARADRDTDRAERGRCFDTHGQVFPLDEHRGQGRTDLLNSNTDTTCRQNRVADQMLHIYQVNVLFNIYFILSMKHFIRCSRPGRVAQSVGHLTRKSGVLGSIPGLATYFRFSFRFFKKGSCQLLAKVCARSTG